MRKGQQTRNCWEQFPRDIVSQNKSKIKTAWGAAGELKTSRAMGAEVPCTRRALLWKGRWGLLQAGRLQPQSHCREGQRGKEKGGLVALSSSALLFFVTKVPTWGSAGLAERDA